MSETTAEPSSVSFSAVILAYCYLNTLLISSTLCQIYYFSIICTNYMIRVDNLKNIHLELTDLYVTLHVFSSSMHLSAVRRGSLALLRGNEL